MVSHSGNTALHKCRDNAFGEVNSVDRTRIYAKIFVSTPAIGIEPIIFHFPRNGHMIHRYAEGFCHSLNIF